MSEYARALQSRPSDIVAASYKAVCHPPSKCLQPLCSRLSFGFTAGVVPGSDRLRNVVIDKYAISGKAIYAATPPDSGANLPINIVKGN